MSEGEANFGPKIEEAMFNVSTRRFEEFAQEVQLSTLCSNSQMKIGVLLMSKTKLTSQSRQIPLLRGLIVGLRFAPSNVSNFYH
jgi:hypothetical protein